MKMNIAWICITAFALVASVFYLISSACSGKPDSDHFIVMSMLWLVLANIWAGNVEKDTNRNDEIMKRINEIEKKQEWNEHRHDPFEG